MKPVTQDMKPATSKGVTIIELIMVIIIVGILAGVSSLYIKQVIDQWRFLLFVTKRYLK